MKAELSKNYSRGHFIYKVGFIRMSHRLYIEKGIYRENDGELSGATKRIKLDIGPSR